MNRSCIIVDDEFLARKRILKLLEKHNDILVLTECRNGKEAVEQISLRNPDFIFLDIEMPDLDGFSVLKTLEYMPYIIFTTAYDQFALKAFEINAVDYLLKPFDEERMDNSLNRMREILQKDKAVQLSKQINALFKAHSDKEEANQDFKFEIKKNGRILTVSTKEIVTILSDGNYLILNTLDQKHLYRSTMHKISKVLERETFVRIHRSILVNKQFVSKIVYKGNSEYKVMLKTKESYISGRSYKDNIISVLEEFNT